MKSWCHMCLISPVTIKCKLDILTPLNNWRKCITSSIWGNLKYIIQKWNATWIHFKHLETTRQQYDPIQVHKHSIFPTIPNSLLNKAWGLWRNACRRTRSSSSQQPQKQSNQHVKSYHHVKSFCHRGLSWAFTYLSNGFMFIYNHL